MSSSASSSGIAFLDPLLDRVQDLAAQTAKEVAALKELYVQALHAIAVFGDILLRQAVGHVQGEDGGIALEWCSGGSSQTSAGSHSLGTRGS
jgi:hypothetical protein